MMYEPSNVFLFIDMDGTIADYHSAVSEVSNIGTIQEKKQFWQTVAQNKLSNEKKLKDLADRSDGFYSKLKPIDGAIETINQLVDLGYNVYFLSSPEVMSTTCHSDKNAWIKKHFGDKFAKKLILTNDKTLVGAKGSINILIDDLPQKGIVSNPNWKQILKLNEFNSGHVFEIAVPFISIWQINHVKSVINEVVDDLKFSKVSKMISNYSVVRIPFFELEKNSSYLIKHYDVIFLAHCESFKRRKKIIEFTKEKNICYKLFRIESNKQVCARHRKIYKSGEERCGEIDYKDCVPKHGLKKQKIAIITNSTLRNSFTDETFQKVYNDFCKF